MVDHELSQKEQKPGEQTFRELPQEGHESEKQTFRELPQDREPGEQTSEGLSGPLAEREKQLLARRKKAEELLREAIARELAGEEPETTRSETLLWNTLILYQDVPFVTAKNLDFTYSIRGYEMFVSRKDKSITRSTVNLAFGMAMQLLKEDLPISGPKKLKTFGASYLYPIFIRIGVIPPEKTKRRRKKPAEKTEKTPEMRETPKKESAERAGKTPEES